MDLFTAIRERRSCRKFLPDAVSREDIEKIIESAIWAPSPANNQPWEFIVITGDGIKEKIFSEAERCKKVIFEKSGWKWINHYDVNFVKGAPVIIAVVGNPQKSGADIFMEEGPSAYRECCGAAIQNMLLTAHALGLSTLWFTMFEKGNLKGILDIEGDKSPIALILTGKAGAELTETPRKSVIEKTRYLD